MKIIVIGAGIIGTVTAYHLAKAGHNVTIIEKRGGAGLFTSFANAAQLSYSYVEPMADPAILPHIPRWLFAKDSPVQVHFRADYAMWSWCIQLLMQCTKKRFTANRDAILTLAMQSREAMEEFLAEHPIAFNYRSTGKLHLYGDEASFSRAKDHASYKQSLGFTQEILEGKAACLAREPALHQYPGAIYGGVFSPLDATGGAHSFAQGLVKLIEAPPYNVQFKFNTECTRIITHNDHIAAIETNTEELQADTYVIATGPETPKLLKTIGLNLPIYPLKGYSLTLPVKHSGNAPNISITDHAHKVVYAPLGETLRIAGGVELAGYDTSCPSDKIQRLSTLVEASFPGLCDHGQATSWAGLRPATPSGVPIIGQAKPYRNLFLNVGHGSLGWTLAQGSAKRVVDFIRSSH